MASYSTRFSHYPRASSKKASKFVERRSRSFDVTTENVPGGTQEKEPSSYPNSPRFAKGALDRTNCECAARVDCIVQRVYESDEAGAGRPRIRALGLSGAAYFAHRLAGNRRLGAILMTGYLGGATATNVRVGDPSFVVTVILGILVWLGLYLRDQRLRAFAPLKS